MEAEATRCALTERSCDGFMEGATFEVCRTSHGRSTRTHCCTDSHSVHVCWTSLTRPSFEAEYLVRRGDGSSLPFIDKRSIFEWLEAKNPATVRVRNIVNSAPADEARFAFPSREVAVANKDPSRRQQMDGSDAMKHLRCRESLEECFALVPQVCRATEQTVTVSCLRWLCGPGKLTSVRSGGQQGCT